MCWAFFEALNRYFIHVFQNEILNTWVFLHLYLLRFDFVITEIIMLQSYQSYPQGRLPLM
jgi:hypothetical protein